MAVTAKRSGKVEEKPLPATRFEDGEIDLSHLAGHKEMQITEIHQADHAGPNNGDDGFIIVFEDEVGNNRVGRISRVQMRKTLRDLGFDVVDY